MERAVVDASVAVKWFVDERDTDKAIRLKALYTAGSIGIIAPTLIHYEVANALRYHPHYRLTEPQLAATITRLKGMQIIIDPTPEMWTRTFEISRSEDISVYDATYIAVSMLLDAEMVTADKRLLKKLSEKTKDGITLLSEFQA